MGLSKETWHEERLLIDGKLVEAEGGATYDNINPANEEVIAITPWNYPNQINIAKVAPALAAGCTVVLKPAPDTPWTGLALGRLAAEHTDIPPGVLNVVTAADKTIGAVLTASPDVDMISF